VKEFLSGGAGIFELGRQRALISIGLRNEMFACWKLGESGSMPHQENFKIDAKILQFRDISCNCKIKILPVDML